MQQFIIYSIWVVIWYPLITIEILGLVRLASGVVRSLETGVENICDPIELNCLNLGGFLQHSLVATAIIRVAQLITTVMQ